MEEMKNIVIQTLETRGVLGQIRAKLRSSVFKIVDEQDQRATNPSGCGLKWENPLLYKIKETNVGGVISELIREFMEYLKMDYSLSVFIPECSISPERLKKDEIMAKLGMNINMFNSEIPIMFFIIHYFIESIQSDPQRVYESLNKIAHSDAEKYSDDTIIRNLCNYQANAYNEGEDQMTQKMNMNEERKYNEAYEDEIGAKEKEVSRKKNKIENEFEKLDSEEMNRNRRSYEFEDRRASSIDSIELTIGKGRNENKQSISSNNKQQVQNNQKQIKHENNLDDEINDIGFNSRDRSSPSTKLRDDLKAHTINSDGDDIVEEIMVEEDLDFEKSNDKKISSSNNNFTISQSGGYDGTVDSNALEKYNYIEPVEK